MDMEIVKFLTWCFGVHCLLFALMDANFRQSLILLYNRIRYR
jgi:hypothetical protein